MKRPRVPPIGQGERARLDLFQPAAEVDGQYLHWEELRHRKPPPSYTSETWWAFIKSVRAILYQEIPLLDQSGRRFRFAMTNSIQLAVHQIDRAMSGRIELPEEVINPATRDRYLIASLMDEAITSSQLEGAATTHKVASEMLRSGRKPKTHDEKMIRNNYLAMRWIREQVHRPLSQGLLLQLHRILGEDALEVADAAGRLRRSDEPVKVIDNDDGETLHVPPPADELEDRIAVMCQFANENESTGAFLHPLLRALALHFWLAYDHPFVDGNGRTARALFYWSMLRQGYWLTEFIALSHEIKRAPTKYARAFLYTESDDDDLTYFFVHQLECLKRALDSLFEHLKRASSEIRGIENALKHTDLNHRQVALLAHAMRHPNAHYTIEAHRQSHGVAYDTARTDLLGLVKRGYLDQQQRGRAFVFVPGRKLETSGR